MRGGSNKHLRLSQSIFQNISSCSYEAQGDHCAATPVQWIARLPDCDGPAQLVASIFRGPSHEISRRRVEPIHASGDQLSRFTTTPAPMQPTTTRAIIKHPLVREKVLTFHEVLLRNRHVLTTKYAAPTGQMCASHSGSAVRLLCDESAEKLHFRTPKVNTAKAG